MSQKKISFNKYQLSQLLFDWGSLLQEDGSFELSEGDPETKRYVDDFVEGLFLAYITANECDH